MKKNLVLRLLLMTAFAFMLHSCRNDYIPEKENYNNKSAFQLTSKKISLSDSKHKTILASQLQKTEEKMRKIKPSFHSKSIAYSNSVSIDADNVIYIENGTNYHTYTFNIIREDAAENAPLENLVLSPLTDGTYRELLFTYNFTPAEKQSLSEGLPVDTKNKVTVTELTSVTYNNNGQLQKNSCGWSSTTIWESCSEAQHGEWNIGEWHQCTASIPPKAYTVLTYSCGSESGEGGGGGSGSSGSGDGGSSGGGGSDTGETPPCNENGILTGPQPPLFLNPDECSGIPTQPNFPNTTPCENLNILFDPTKGNIKPLITGGLYTAVDNAAGELGIMLKRESNGTITSEALPYSPNPNGGNPSIRIKTGGNYYTAIHSHPKDAYPMFSWSDIYFLYRLEIATNYHNDRKTSFLLVCEDDNGVKQTYAITFESIGAMMEEVFTNPQNIGCTEKEIIERMDIELNEKYDKEAKKINPDYERVFLQLNFGTNIGLYKANADLTGWSKLSISTNSDTATVISTNCN